MANILFWLYAAFFILVCTGAATPAGKKLQYEYLAFRDTKRFYKQKGIRWP